MATKHDRKVLQDILDGKSSGGRTDTKAKAKTIASPSETQIQKSCIEWFSTQYRKTWEAGLLIHIANERKCSGRAGAELKGMGVRKGIPDLQLLMPRHGFNGLFIEMKKKGGYPRPEQKAYMDSLTLHGYLCVICRSLEEFMSIINQYLN